MSTRYVDFPKRGFLGGFDRFALALVLISALGAALVLARGATYGVALYADSIFYIDAARNLLAGEAFVTFTRDGRVTPLTHWPPLYPLALAAPSVFGIDARDAAGPLNAALLGLTAFAVGRWALRRLESKALALWGCAAVALAPPLAQTASWALSETPFILLATLALIRADDFLQDGGRAALIWAAALSALAWLTRYIGFALVGTILALVVLRPGASLRDRARGAVVYSLIAALPTALWMLRNMSLTGTPAGIRRDPWSNFSEMPVDAAFVIGGWFTQGFLSGDALPLAAFCAAAAGLGALCAAAAWALISSRGEAWRGRRSLCAFGAFAAAYPASFLFSAIALKALHSSPFHIWDKFWIPLYVPLLLVALPALDRLISVRGGEARVFAEILDWANNRAARRGTLAMSAALALWLLLGAAQNVSDILRVNAESVRDSYSAAAWINSETLEYLRENPRRARVITNNAHMVYIHADDSGWAYAALPAFSLETANASLDDVLDNAIETSDGEILVVWLDNWYKNGEAGYGADTLRASPRLEVEAELSDGAIFRVKTDGARERIDFLSPPPARTDGSLARGEIPASI